MGKVVILVTSHKGGCWCQELVGPYYYFKDHGLDVVFTSPTGGEVEFEDASVHAESPEIKKFLSDSQAMDQMHKAVPIKGIGAITSIDAIFIPGGLGILWEAPLHREVRSLLSASWALGSVIATVGSGVAALLKAVRIDGTAFVTGRRVTGLTNYAGGLIEDAAKAGRGRHIPYSVEDALKELGAQYEHGEEGSVFTVVDGNLISGQNPESSLRVAELTVEAIEARTSTGRKPDLVDPAGATPELAINAEPRA